MTDDCLFCRIVAGLTTRWVVWDDRDYIAFLTPFPNTPGVTVVATKAHKPSYVFALDEEVYSGLLNAARYVGRLLDRSLAVKRTGLIAEGLGIDHAHVKLVPMHGLPEGPWQPVLSEHREFSTVYRGYLSSHDGPNAPRSILDRLAAVIRAADPG